MCFKIGRGDGCRHAVHGSTSNKEATWQSHVAVHRGVLKELGSATVDVRSETPGTTYTFIEFMDGTLLRRIAVVGGYD